MAYNNQVIQQYMEIHTWLDSLILLELTGPVVLLTRPHSHWIKTVKLLLKSVIYGKPPAVWQQVSMAYVFFILHVITGWLSCSEQLSFILSLVLHKCERWTVENHSAPSVPHDPALLFISLGSLCMYFIHSYCFSLYNMRTNACVSVNLLCAFTIWIKLCPTHSAFLKT